MPEPTVLIIEDDASLLRGLSDNFQMQGFRVLTADNGAAGLCIALAESIDLILLDIMLPKMNGFELCQRIRQQNREVTIIMLTAKGQESDIVRGLELGADDYLTKPFSIRELLARAKAFLRRKAEPIVNEYHFGDYRLDLVSHQFFRVDDPVDLTAKEFSLLEYMVRHAGRALTRSDILNAVWGNRVIVTHRSVDRCVTTLRSKIEPNPKLPVWIHTIRDIGYRFEMRTPQD